MLRLLLIGVSYTVLLGCSLGSHHGGWVLYRGGSWSKENMAISFRTKHSATNAWRKLVENEEEYDPNMSKADGLRLRRRLDEEAKLAEGKTELLSNQHEEQYDDCLLESEVANSEWQKGRDELEEKGNGSLYLPMNGVVNRIGMASLFLCFSLFAIRAANALVEIGRRYVVQSKVPSSDENEEQQSEYDQQTTTAKQKNLGEPIEDEKVIFTSMLNVGGSGSDEGTEEELGNEHSSTAKKEY